MEVETLATAPQKVQKVKIPEAKHWAGCTLNNYTDADLKAFDNLKSLVDYFVYGKEVGASGTPHLQFMVCFKTKRRLTALKKIFPTAHWEMKAPKSSMERSANYCKKGEQSKDEWMEWQEDGPNFGKNANFVEYGILPADQKTAGLKVIADNYADTVAKAKEGRIDEILPEHQLRYYSAIKKIEADAKRMPDDLNWKEGEQPNFWIWGPTSMFIRVNA